MTLSVHWIGIIGLLLSSLVAAIGTLCMVITVLYRQILRERDKLLDERNRLLQEKESRLIDLWRDLEERNLRIASLEAAVDRYQHLTAEVTTELRTALYASVPPRIAAP